MSLLALGSGSTGIIGRIRQLVQDLDTTAPGSSDAQYTSAWNSAQSLFRQKIHPRVVWDSELVNGLTGSGTQRSKTTLVAYQKILNAYLESSSGLTRGTPLERYTVPEILGSQDVDPAPGTIGYYAMEPLGTTGVSSTAPLWKFYPWRIPSGSWFVSLRAEAVPTALSLATDYPDMEEAEQEVICRMAAVEMSILNGRPPEWLAPLISMLPSEVTEAMQLGARRSTPGRARLEVA